MKERNNLDSEISTSRNIREYSKGHAERVKNVEESRSVAIQTFQLLRKLVWKFDISLARKGVPLEIWFLIDDLQKFTEGYGPRPKTTGKSPFSAPHLQCLLYLRLSELYSNRNQPVDAVRSRLLLSDCLATAWYHEDWRLSLQSL